MLTFEAVTSNEGQFFNQSEMHIFFIYLLKIKKCNWNFADIVKFFCDGPFMDPGLKTNEAKKILPTII